MRGRTLRRMVAIILAPVYLTACMAHRSIPVTDLEPGAEEQVRVYLSARYYIDVQQPRLINDTLFGLAGPTDQARSGPRCPLGVTIGDTRGCAPRTDPAAAEASDSVVIPIERIVRVEARRADAGTTAGAGLGVLLFVPALIGVIFIVSYGDSGMRD